MKRVLLGGLTALIFATTNVGNVLATEKKDINCLSETEVRSVSSQIHQHFKNVRPEVYLIENVPESKNGYGKGGQLTIFLPSEEYLKSGGKYALSIFDRTDRDPKKWYNVSNWDSSGIGCAERGVIYLHAPNGNSQIESQEKFNAFFRKVKNKIVE